MAPSKGRHPSYNKDKIDIDPNAHLAIDELVAQEQDIKKRQKIVRLSVDILLVLLLTLLLTLVVLPWSFGFYCSHIIGTNYETLIIYKYPNFTEKMVRTAVITDKWYLNVFSPIINVIREKEDIEYRRAVIELGLEATSEGERDLEKIKNLRAVVAASLLKSPSGLAFAVFELPPKKVRYPSDSMTYMGRGLTYVKLKQFNNAIADYDKAIRLNPNDAATHSISGSKYSELKQFNNAIADYDKAIRLNPNDAMTYIYRGSGYSDLKQFDNAIADYNQAILLNPNFAIAYYFRGFAYFELNKLQEGCADLKEACRLGKCSGYDIARKKNLCR